jgi:hypothetical protein
VPAVRGRNINPASRQVEKDSDLDDHSLQPHAIELDDPEAGGGVPEFVADPDSRESGSESEDEWEEGNPPPPPHIRFPM